MRVLVYGSLKKRGLLSTYLENSKYIDTIEVTIPDMAMYPVIGPKGNYSYPAILDNVDQKPIIGEIYEISKTTLKYLDMAEGYPNYYQRFELDLGKEYGKVWVYYLLDHKLCDLTKPIKEWDVSYEQNHTFAS